MQQAAMHLLTCNLRDARAADGDNSWPQRLPLCVRLLETRQPDVICCQEARAGQRQDLARALPGYDSYGLAESRDDDATPNLILFRRDRWQLLGYGGFWLSATPALAGTCSWGGRYIRLVNWVRLRARHGSQTWCILNTHLEDDRPDTALQQLQVLLAGLPPQDHDIQLLAGDLNNGPGSPVLQALAAAGWHDSWQAAHPGTSAGRSFHAFAGTHATVAPSEQIDWILYRGATRVLAAEIIRDSLEGRYPSDHFFLQARFGEDDR